MKKWTEEEIQNRDLMAPCGLYCGACGIYIATRILKLLPKTNCGQCGCPSCIAFAASLSLQESVPEKCPHIQSPLGEQGFYPVYDTDGNLVSTVALNINSAKAIVSQYEKDNPSQPNSITRLEAVQKDSEEANQSLPMPLSSRELEVLTILAEGTSNNEISRIPQPGDVFFL